MLLLSIARKIAKWRLSMADIHFGGLPTMAAPFYRFWQQRQRAVTGLNIPASVDDIGSIGARVYRRRVVRPSPNVRTRRVSRRVGETDNPR